MTRVHSKPGEAQAHAAEECSAIAADLERLRGLIADAGSQIAGGFSVLADPAANEGARAQALAQAVRALQFEDIALQLVGHAQTRLALLETCVQDLSPQASDTLSAAIAHRAQHHPVGQTGLGAGEIELF